MKRNCGNFPFKEHGTTTTITMKTTNVAQTLLSNVTEVCEENEELKKRVKELETDANEINKYVKSLMWDLSRAQANAEVAESRLEKIENLSVEGYIRIANALRNIRDGYQFDSRRCQSDTKYVLDLVCGLENVCHYTDEVRHEKIQRRKEAFKQTKMRKTLNANRLSSD